MAFSVQGKGDVASFRAGDSLAAGVVVTFGGNSTTGIHVDRADGTGTNIGFVLGVALSGASSTGEVVDILLAAPIAKVQCALSVSAGAIVGPGTGAGGAIVERANPGTVTTVLLPTLGMALEAGDTNSVISVLLMPTIISPSDG